MAPRCSWDKSPKLPSMAQRACMSFLAWFPTLFLSGPSWCPVLWMYTLDDNSLSSMPRAVLSWSFRAGWIRQPGWSKTPVPLSSRYEVVFCVRLYLGPHLSIFHLVVFLPSKMTCPEPCALRFRVPAHFLPVFFRMFFSGFHSWDYILHTVCTLASQLLLHCLYYKNFWVFYKNTMSGWIIVHLSGYKTICLTFPR